MMRHGRRIAYDPRYNPPNLLEKPFGQVLSFPDERQFRPLPWRAPSIAQVSRSIPWRYKSAALVTQLAGLGIEQSLIGIQVLSAGQVPVPSAGPGPVPYGKRCVVDVFQPLALDVFGRPLWAALEGTSLVYRLYVDGKLIRGFEADSLWPQSSREAQRRPLAELVGGQTMKVTVQLTTNGMGIASVGVRMEGTWEPLDDDDMSHGTGEPPPSEWRGYQTH